LFLQPSERVKRNVKSNKRKDMLSQFGLYVDGVSGAVRL
jgi:hypothetical protein